MQDIEYALEDFHKVKEEAQPLLELHWDEIAVHKDKIKLNPDWEKVEALSKEGKLGVYTVRDNGVLVGYFAVIADTSLHYRDHIFAHNDVIFIKKEYRNRKIGFGLIDFAERDLKRKGVSLLLVNTKVHQPFDELMLGMGYDLMERLYSKYIGD